MAQFKTIHTRLGLAAIGRAEATGSSINLTHMAVGDGAGNPVQPDESQSNLVREIFRAPINRVFQSPDDTRRFTAELIVPASAGGFVIREVGVFDASGALFAVGNVPDTYKPQSSEGAFTDTLVRLEFLVTNASVVTVQIDPNVTVATRAWVLGAVNTCSIIPGGTVGQVLVKKSNSCGDTEWRDPTNANVVVDAIEEQQTLAASQTAVTLTTTTTRGLSLYIEGVRLRRNQWTANGTDPTKLTLSTSYPAGSLLTAVQNEPAGSAPAPLERSKNLSDLGDKAAARANLDVFSKAEARQLSPAGQVAHFARSAAPTGWLKANGAAVSRTAYSDLFAAIGTAFGAGDGFNTFNLPDLRGEFLRGWDDGRGIDADRALGSAQADEFRSHSHTTNWQMWKEDGAVADHISNGGNQFENPRFTLPTEATGGNETRPRNIALLACIKF